MSFVIKNKICEQGSNGFIKAAYIAVIFYLLLFTGCGEEPARGERFRVPSNTIKPGTSSIEARKQYAAQKGTGLIEKDVKRTPGEIELPKILETDFITSSLSRDPFFPYVEIIAHQEKAQKSVQRNVKLHEYDVTDLRLIALITNIGDPRAMVTIPGGVGFVIKRGDYVGRADYIDRGKTGEKIQVNWRVARIHGGGKEEERGIYLIRDDPTTSKGIDVTRFIPLHPKK